MAGVWTPCLVVHISPNLAASRNLFWVTFNGTVNTNDLLKIQNVPQITKSLNLGRGARQTQCHSYSGWLMCNYMCSDEVGY